MTKKYICVTVLFLIISLTQAAKLRLLSGSTIACSTHNDCPNNSYCDYQTSPYSCAPSPCVHDGDCPNSTCQAGKCLV